MDKNLYAGLNATKSTQNFYVENKETTMKETKEGLNKCLHFRIT